MKTSTLCILLLSLVACTNNATTVSPRKNTKAVSTRKSKPDTRMVGEWDVFRKKRPKEIAGGMDFFKADNVYVEPLNNGPKVKAYYNYSRELGGLFMSYEFNGEKTLKNASVQFLDSNTVYIEFKRDKKSRYYLRRRK